MHNLKGKLLRDGHAEFGDICKAAGWRNVPLSSFRLNNIRTEYIFDMRPIMEVSGPLPYSLKTGIEQTVKWMREWAKFNPQIAQIYAEN